MIGRGLWSRALRRARYADYVQRVAMSCSRGALDRATRSFEPHLPGTWEFSAFSQNGEDGVIDHLLSLVDQPNRYFVEIGASDGLENNSAFLGYVKRYEGVMIEGEERVARKARQVVELLSPGVKYLHRFVTPSTVGEVIGAARHADPDLLSVDIDSNDLHVVRALLAAGMRPKLVCVEYNSAFGPERSLTVPLDHPAGHVEPLHYGASVCAWRRLFAANGYRFVTVESRGVNAFFVDPGAVDESRLGGVQGIGFAENLGQLERYGCGWEAQFERLRGLPLVQVDEAGALIV